MRNVPLVLVASLLAAPVVAQQKPPPQKVVPPPTHYWLSAATQSGFSMSPGAAADMGQMMRMALGGGGAVKILSLDLGSRLPPKGAPTGTHMIPSGMQMGPSLLLKAPPKAPPPQPGVPEDIPPFERPKGRLLLFWGCGETARPGQPVVFDFAKIAEGQMPPNLFTAETVRIANPPSASRYPTYGGWPNDDPPSRKGIPANASLVGDHRVVGPSTPEIAFSLQQDWMAPLVLRQTPLPNGALRLDWNTQAGATGHFAQLFGGSERDEGTVVFWSSSEVQTFLSGLADFVAPAEAARLVQRRQLLAPATTTCTVPREVMAAAEGALLTLVSHGPEVNIIHPPRPEDPKIPWVQEWAVKARFVARTGAISGMDTPGGAVAGSASSSGKPKCKPDAAQDVAAGVGGAIAGSLGRGLGRALGRSKPREDCEP
ncbi:hypothetical protein [Thermaurantiacus tibetensis]|uniref:hypothetical protein n=1 Tax=Thermaurantiacus tibetensis TaxID=2759035 RepID=UPI00188F529C|nr:hypothetical protein [Thermaurantiacus tibetensis]